MQTDTGGANNKAQASRERGGKAITRDEGQGLHGSFVRTSWRSFLWSGVPAAVCMQGHRPKS